jgi:hypothetical protein
VVGLDCGEPLIWLEMKGKLGGGVIPSKQASTQAEWKDTHSPHFLDLSPLSLL